MGGHRDGDPRLDPEDDGAGRDRDAAAGGGHPDDPAGADRRRHRVARSSSPVASASWSRSGPSAAASTRSASTTAAAGPMVGRVVGMGVHGGLVVETTLDPAEQPFLDDHQIEGTPVLPGVMGIEAFAEVARLPLPGWHVVAVEDVEFLAPCKFYRGEPRTLTITATLPTETATQLVADCRLTGSRQLAEPDRAAGDRRTSPAGSGWPGRRSRPTSPCPPPPSPNGERRDGRRHLRGLLPRSRLPGARAGVARRARPGGPVRDRPARRPRPGGAARAGVAPPDRAVLPDGGHLGDRSRRTLRPAPARRPGRAARGARRAPSGRVEAMVRAPATAASTAGSSTRPATVLLEVHGYRTIELPGGVDPDTAAPLAEAMA